MWVEYFEELRKRSAPKNPVDIQPTSHDLRIICTLHTKEKEEIRKAIMQLKNDKAAGPDDIPAEAPKVDIDTSVDMLYPPFFVIWEKKRSHRPSLVKSSTEFC